MLFAMPIKHLPTCAPAASTELLFWSREPVAHSSLAFVLQRRSRLAELGDGRGGPLENSFLSLSPADSIVEQSRGAWPGRLPDCHQCQAYATRVPRRVPSPERKRCRQWHPKRPLDVGRRAVTSFPSQPRAKCQQKGRRHDRRLLRPPDVPQIRDMWHLQ